MSDLDDDLRTTAEAIIAEAEEVRRLEESKLELGPDDPQVHALSRQAKVAADRLARETAVELEIATDEVSEPRPTA